jgi:hypothetical protein
MEFVRKLLNEKMGQKIKELEQSLLDKIGIRLRTTAIEEKIHDLFGTIKSWEYGTQLEIMRNNVEKLNQNDSDLMKMIYTEMENAKEERRTLNENLARTQIT